ncbi:phosphoribosyltransferase family protein [Flexithrix dorotheae]|uniref:phosphoribosyltransferase family protein n=1 Tax=Flexithrix dorotheae TaxID=70993 RepID=UPI0003825204|nr:phosphoribosyltransferase family protein [Flexithrix dorotheae]
MQNIQNRILNKEETLRKIKRIAFEIYEHNFEEKEIIIAGIYDTGYIFADILKQEVERISPIKVLLVKVQLNKGLPQQSNVELDCDPAKLKGKTVIVADDVLNTGRTLAYSLNPFLHTELKKLQVAVIIDRAFRLFPISADFVGYSLSTTVNEHVTVELENNERYGVYLN